MPLFVFFRMGRLLNKVSQKTCQYKLKNQEKVNILFCFNAGVCVFKLSFMKKNIFTKIVLILSILIFSFSVYSQKINRIISLAPSLTKNIYLLNQQSKLVGCTNYCKNDQLPKIPEVANSVKVNLEKVISLIPDIVLVTSLTQSETIESLRNVGVKVEYLDLPKSYNEICSQLIYLGKLLGVEEKAIEIVQIQTLKLQNLQKNINTKKPALSMFMQIGVKPLWAVIPNTFLNDYLLFSNGTNIINDLKHGAVSRESIILRNPDVIFIVTMGNLGEKEKSNWEKYTNLNAVKNNRIFIINSELACEPTPTAFVETLEIIIALLNTLK